MISVLGTSCVGFSCRGFGYQFFLFVHLLFVIDENRVVSGRFFYGRSSLPSPFSLSFLLTVIRKRDAIGEYLGKETFILFDFFGSMTYKSE